MREEEEYSAIRCSGGGRNSPQGQDRQKLLNLTKRTVNKKKLRVIKAKKNHTGPAQLAGEKEPSHRNLTREFKLSTKPKRSNALGTSGPQLSSVHERVGRLNSRKQLGPSIIKLAGTTCSKPRKGMKKAPEGEGLSDKEQHNYEGRQAWHLKKSRKNPEAEREEARANLNRN